jgi:hypothetical protein
MQHHCTNKGDNPDGQCTGKMAIEGALDNMVDEIMVDKNVENVGMCKYNLDYMGVGIEVAKQKEVEMWIVQREVELVEWVGRMPRPFHVLQGGDALMKGR